MTEIDKAQKEQRRVVHYTSAENALKIIESKTLWLRNAKCMSDYMEVLHGQALFRQFFGQQTNISAFRDALNPCATDIADEALQLFDNWWSDIQQTTYICCISKHYKRENYHGRLSMWRAFGTTSVRAALVLHLPQGDTAAGLPIMLSPVAYFDYHQLEEEFLRVICQIKTNQETLRRTNRQILLNYLFDALRAATVSLKHPGFVEEEEWRIIYSPTMRPSPLMERSVVTVAGIPQIVYKIHMEDRPSDKITGVSIPQMLERVIIGPSPFAGPSPFPFPIVEAFIVALLDAGISEAEARSRVVASGIPLRT